MCTYVLVYRYFVVSPNVFRLNVEETVSVQVASPCNVELYLQAPGRAEMISRVTQNFQPGETFLFPSHLMGGSSERDTIGSRPFEEKMRHILLSIYYIF